MAKIVKANQPPTHRVSPVDRDGLAEFPDEAPVDLLSALDAASETGPEAGKDIEALQHAILDAARSEAAAKVEEAYSEGYRHGAEAGREAFNKTIARAAECIEAAAEGLTAARIEFLASLEPQVVALARLVAERIVGREVRDDPEIVHSVVRRALAKIIDRQRVTVRVHPGDLDALRTHRLRLLDDFEGVGEVVIEGDDSIEAGGAVVESETMQVDAQLKTLLANILDPLEG